MAPALPAPPREPRDPSPRRRALASVDNYVSHMDDEMGLHSQHSLAKDSQEMEQILVDLGGSDMAQADLLQAIKTLETASAEALAADPDAIFPLSGFDLGEVADSEGDTVEEKIKLMQTRLERRCALLQRRLRILQARAIGKRVSEEVAQTFDKCAIAARKDHGAGRPAGLKAILKKIETTANLQACAASRVVVGPKYYNPGTSKGDASRSASIGIASGTLAGLQDTAGALRSHLSVVKHELDSDATASSSGAESNDEDVVYNNPHQQPMPIEKRALWRWQRARAGIASRWGWLQAQVQELEYKIRQHVDLHKQVREAKGPVQLEGEPVAYEGSLPGSEPADDDPATETCARVRPLRRDTFRKRKLLQMHNLHIATDKAAKPTDIRCSCIHPVESCPICTGRCEPMEPAPPISTLPASQRVARVDPCYHSVLSTPYDIPRHVHVSAVASRPWFRSRMSRSWRGAHTPASPNTPPTDHKPKPKRPKHHPTRLKRGRPPLSRKIRMTRESVTRVEEPAPPPTVTQERERRSVGRPSLEPRRRPDYDIDNIVIPASVAANNKPMILTYKEILTPKWRVMDIPQVPLNNGVTKSSHQHRMSFESEEEDVSESAVQARHQRALNRERSRYLRAPRGRRPPAANPPPPAQEPKDLPAPPVVPPTPPLEVQPYSPRSFPLSDDTYHSMLTAMPEGHRASSPSLPPEDDDIDMENNDVDIDVDDGSSTLSPLSPNPYEGDDPDDIEWDPVSEKRERKKNAFR